MRWRICAAMSWHFAMTKHKRLTYIYVNWVGATVRRRIHRHQGTMSTTCTLRTAISGPHSSRLAGLRGAPVSLCNPGSCRLADGVDQVSNRATDACCTRGSIAALMVDDDRSATDKATPDVAEASGEATVLPQEADLREHAARRPAAVNWDGLPGHKGVLADEVGDHPGDVGCLAEARNQVRRMDFVHEIL